MASHYEAPGVKRTAEDAGLASPRDNRRPRASRSRDEILASMHEDLVQRIEELQERGLIEREGLELRALGELQQLDTRDALEVLNQYEGSDFAKVRNKTAYLLGIIHKAVKYGFNARDALMKRSVEKKLDELYSRRIIKPGDLDTRSLGALRRLDEQSALTALQQFEMHKSPDVRRPSAYFMTIVNNVKKSIGKTGHGGEAGGQPLPPPPPPPPPPPMGRQMQAGEPQLVAAAPAAVPVAALQHGRGLTTDVATLLGTLRSWVPQQAQAGVRTAELLSLSVFAGHVHPAAAAKLQELWDDGHQLVAFLDDRAWQGLTELGGPEAISVIDVVMSKLLSAPQDVRDISTFLLGVARSLKQTFGTADRDRPPGPPVLPAYGLAAAPATAPAGLQPLPQQPQPSVAGVPGQGAPSVLIIPPGSFGDAQPSAVPLPPGSNGMAHDGDASQLPPHLQPLPIEVQEKIREVVDTHTPHISYDAFDRKLVDEMAKWGQREMLQVLGELQGNDLSRVKNAPAYIMGIYKRRRRETPHSSGGPR